MPLIAEAPMILRASFEMLARGERPLVATIGYLTDEQHAAINAVRERHDLHRLVSPEIVLLGRHLYRSRVEGDNYAISDIIEQITSALAPTSKVIATHRMTAIISTIRRADGYGNMVLDEAVLELTQRRPKAELFSVIPKGDHNRPHPRAAEDAADMAPAPIESVLTVALAEE